MPTAAELPVGSIVETPTVLYLRVLTGGNPWLVTGYEYRLADEHVQRVLDNGGTVLRVGDGS